ncbi:MAG: hypothetical protein JWR26_953 [Pedosphaera sp.]|nr:hypothetical protein [Pedosphaera sp.]
MNPNQPMPDPSPHGSSTEMNDAILKKLQSNRWKGQAFTVIALGVGLLSIAVGILIAWASSTMVTPMEHLLLRDYPSVLQQTDTNSMTANPTGAKPMLTRAQLDWRHVQVTAAHGKVIILIAFAIALTGVGTLLTLILVIFNRRATLRQINASLAQISNQIKELQGSKGSHEK